MWYLVTVYLDKCVCTTMYKCVMISLYTSITVYLYHSDPVWKCIGIAASMCNSVSVSLLQRQMI